MSFTANTFRRWLAYLIDSGILAILTSAPTVFDFRMWFFGEEILLSWPRLLVLILMPFMYHFGFLMGLSATPGKWLMGLRVVSAQSQGAVNARQALVRTMCVFLTFFFHFAPQIIAFFRADRRQLADLLAGTRVVQFDRPFSQTHSRPFFAVIALLITLNMAKANLIKNAQRFSLGNKGVTLYVPLWDDLI